MNLDEFRREAHALADWMADYLAGVGDERIVPDTRPGEVRRALPAAPPDAPEPFAAMRDDFDRIIYPGMTHWNHPGFFGYFPSNHSPPSILAEMMTAALGAQCMSWQTSPAATELEQVVMDWLRQMIGLPATFTGVIQDAASTSTLVALISARDRVRDGLERATVYLSAEAHSSAPKGARLAGFRPEHVRLLPTDARYAMRVGALEAAIAADRRAGLVPAAIVATVGTTSSTAIDPLPAIGVVAEREGIWLHVDAAFAGSDGPTAWSSTLTSGSWSTSTARRTSCATPRRCSARSGPRPSSSRPATTRRSSTTATGAFPWAGGSARSSSGS